MDSSVSSACYQMFYTCLFEGILLCFLSSLWSIVYDIYILKYHRAVHSEPTLVRVFNLISVSQSALGLTNSLSALLQQAS